MRIKQLYIFLFFIWFGSTIIASATDKADSWTKEKESIVHEVISTFHNSLGFDYLTREECDSLNADGLLSQLDESQRYYTYFELERILIKSSLFRGEIRMAIAQSDQMYSKARALAYPFGNALALNAMGEVYSYTGRLREAGTAYEESLRLLDGMDGEDVHIRMLLVELIDYNLRIRNVNGPPLLQQSPRRRACCNIPACGWGNQPRYMSVNGIFTCYDKPMEVFDYNALKDDPLIEVDTIGLKGSPTNVFKSFTPPQKGAGTMLTGDDTAAQLAGILAKKHLI